MPLHEADRVLRFRHDVEADTRVIFQNIALPPRHFALDGRAGADILFQRREDGSGFILLVDAGVRYLGDTPEIARAFSHGDRRGWRPLTVLDATSAEGALRQADAFFGLGGRDPRLPPPSRPREIVVDAEGTASGARTEPRDPEKDRFGVDLVEEARRGRLEPACFREREIDALVRILSKAGKNAACLVGEPGVGKTAVVEGLAIAIAAGRVPETLRQARLLDVNLSFLGADGESRGSFEERMKALLDLAREDPNVVLFLDELHVIRSPGSNASQMVKADLGRGRVRCVGATTRSEYRTLEADPALARRFQVVPVPALGRDETVAVLRARVPALERHHGVAIPEALLATVVDLASRHVPDRQLPDKAIDLLDEACALARMQADPPAPGAARAAP